MGHKNDQTLIEYAVKELRSENYRLKDEIQSIEENKIRTRESLLKLQSAALEAAANGIVITDAKGKISWANSAFSELTGYSNEEVRGKTPSILKSGKHTDDFYAEIWKTIYSGKTWTGELINKRKDGSLYPAEMTITP